MPSSFLVDYFVESIIFKVMNDMKNGDYSIVKVNGTLPDYGWVYSEMVEMKLDTGGVKMGIKDAVDALRKDLREDEELYYAWQSNIAMSFVDEARRTLGEDIDYDILHEIANTAAKNFLDLLIKE